ncbi:UDP-glycosyltransferase 74E2-like [Benincasa hispida]|uniref:UDP-glycosyltransferase 74E2-like n=1 Tax=Benincasa hispida TaxID=102211 RepID=UPI001900DEE2|nr:UDP-glycosyltransferase 74E2-like [Benincasa hispida]
MEMGEGKKEEIVVVPFPDGQGHINPILQFSKSLALKGLKVTVLHVLNTHEITDHKKHRDMGVGDSSMKIEVEYRPRVPYKGGDPESEPMESYMQRVKTSICFHLGNLLDQRQISNSPIACVVYDSLIPWVLDVAAGFGLSGAPFFTESCAVNAIFYHINRGWLKMSNVMPDETPISLPALPLLQITDFPSLIQNPRQYPVFLSSMIHQFSNRPRWMFINTFHALEPQVSSIHLPFSLISLRLFFLLFKSHSKLLKFLFFKFNERDGDVVKWCSQVQVLAHKSIGCFVTHCGWNSVLEAITCGVPMVSMPQWTDQMTNAKFVEDVWKIGVRVNPKQNGIVRRQEIELCIRKVMEGKKSLEIRQNATKWMKLAAQDQTSDNNIDDFVTQLTNRVI